jgi:thioredoxin reductase (NADPH)
MSEAVFAELEETPDEHGSAPRLSGGQVEELSRVGTWRETRPGEVLYREEDQPSEFFVVLSGTVAMVQDYGGANRVVAVHGPRRFLGELNLLTGQPMLLTAVVSRPGAVLTVPVERLKELVTHDHALGDMILRALLVRRSIQAELGVGLQIIGSRFSPDARRLREFAARNRVPHRWIDLENDTQAEALVHQLGLSPDETPVVIWRGEHLLRNPSNAELARLVNLRHDVGEVSVCDVAVIGAGPGGLAAAVYAASEGLDTIVLDAVATGGQAGTATSIENYLGFPAGISGAELTDRAVIQTKKFGARIIVPAGAIALERETYCHVVRVEGEEVVRAKAVVVATGARYRRLDLPRLEEFEGVSVHYMATEMEAKMCVGDPVVVVGGGNSAGQATVFLARQALRVLLVCRGADLRQDMSRYLADRVERTPTVEVAMNSEVRELVGDRTLEAVTVEDRKTGRQWRVEARAMFVFIGAEPHTGWLDGQLDLDEKGYVLTGPDAKASADLRGQTLHRMPRMLETVRPGIFAVGDVRSGSVKRVASAVGEGAMAVRLVHEHLDDVGGVVS